MPKIFSLPKFKKQYKKFPDSKQKQIKTEIKKISKNPLIGESKKGILKGVRVYKWKSENQLYLLAYEFDKKENTVYLYSIAPYEGFYKDLEKYKK